MLNQQDMKEQSQENIILLMSNTDRSEYDLLSVKGMERTEIFNLLFIMKDDDRQNVEAYFDRARAWVTLLVDERSEEVEEYHLDYAYDTDTHEITDYKKLKEENSINEMKRANIPVEYGDVIVRFFAPDSGEYETIKITNIQSEVQNVLYDLLMREMKGQHGNALDYLCEKRGGMFRLVQLITANTRHLSLGIAEDMKKFLSEIADE